MQNRTFVPYVPQYEKYEWYESNAVNNLSENIVATAPQIMLSLPYYSGWA